jgi:hypothetical protein
MVHVLVRILLLELGPLLIHVVIHLQLHKQLMYKITASDCCLTGEFTIDCPATPVFAVATATDAGSAFTLTSADVTTNGSCAGSYSITRTWTATDSCGNSSTASQTINVQDKTAPVICRGEFNYRLSCYSSICCSNGY